jgi:hypothetical protein
MAVVSVTRLRVRRLRFLPFFLLYAMRSARQVRRARGNLGLSLLNDRDWTFWTRTVWTEHDAMKSFMISGPHGQAMRKLLEWCDEASLVHWAQETAQEPEWTEAHRRLQAEGRRSKVNHPSGAHERFEIRPPRV